MRLTRGACAILALGAASATLTACGNDSPRPSPLWQCTTQANNAGSVAPFASELPDKLQTSATYVFVSQGLGHDVALAVDPPISDAVGEGAPARVNPSDREAKSIALELQAPFSQEFPCAADSLNNFSSFAFSSLSPDMMQFEQTHAAMMAQYKNVFDNELSTPVDLKHAFISLSIDLVEKAKNNLPDPHSLPTHDRIYYDKLSGIIDSNLAKLTALNSGSISSTVSMGNGNSPATTRAIKAELASLPKPPTPAVNVRQEAAVVAAPKFAA